MTRIKRQGVILLSLLACLPLAIPSVASADVCLDLDNGNSPGTKGAVEVAGPSGIPVKYWDTCSGNTLTEQVCVKDPSQVDVGQRLLPQGVRRTVSVECPGGCGDGACVGLQSGCVDTDAANDPFKKGTVRIYSNAPGRTVTTSQPDQCTVGGRSVREYGCMGPRVVQLGTRECRNGCVEGQCVDPSQSTEGCFIAVKVEEKPTIDKSGSLFTLLGVRSVVGKHVGDLLEKDPDDSSGISLDVFDKQGTLLKRYSPSSSVYGVAENVGSHSEAIVIPRAVRQLYIPYDTLIGSARITSKDQTVPITFTSASLICARDCLLPNETSSVGKGERQCCPGSVRSYFNDTSYVCVSPNTKKGKQSLSDN